MAFYPFSSRHNENRVRFPVAEAQVGPDTGRLLRHSQDPDAVAGLASVPDVLFGPRLMPDALPEMIDLVVRGDLLFHDVVECVYPAGPHHPPVILVISGHASFRVVSVDEQKIDFSPPRRPATLFLNSGVCE